MLPALFQTLRLDDSPAGTSSTREGVVSQNSSKVRTWTYYRLRANTGTHRFCDVGNYWTSGLVSSTWSEARHKLAKLGLYLVYMALYDLNKWTQKIIGEVILTGYLMILKSYYIFLDVIMILWLCLIRKETLPFRASWQNIHGDITQGLEFSSR